MSDDVIVLNDYSGVQLLERTRTSGKKQVSISIKAEPIAINCDPRALSAPVAAALVESIKQDIRGISESVTPATLKKREAQAKAFAAGDAATVKQFSGGRMGSTPPHAHGDKLYNNSGRLAEGIAAAWRAQTSSWGINLPANRFAPDFLARPGAMAVFERLVSLVKSLRAPFEQPLVDAAIRQTMASMISVARGRGDDLRAARNRAVMGMVKQGLRLVA